MRILAAGSDVAPTFTHFVSLSAPRGGWPCLGRPCAAAVVPPLFTACGSLPPEGAAAPAARQSRFRGPCWNEEPPRSFASRNSLPPEGAAAPAARQSRFRGPCWLKEPPRSAPARRHRFTGLHHAGFTLLELLVVVAIIAVATAGVSLSLRDSSQTALEREAQRLAVLFESARAQSRASGTAVIWRPTVDGFRFEGLQPGALPTRWLEAGTRAGANVAIQLGPEPIIGAQAVDILSGGQDDTQPARVLRIATDGLRPFALQTAEQP